MADVCLLIIDMVHDFLDRMEGQERQRLIKNTNELIRAARNAGISVYWVKQEFEADLSDAFLEMKDRSISITIAGTHGADIHADLDRDADDPVIVKKRYSAFFGTNLDQIIDERSIKKLILAGVYAHACIRTTAIDAYQRDIRVIIAADCVGASNRGHAEISLRYMQDKIARLHTNREIISSLY